MNGSVFGRLTVLSVIRGDRQGLKCLCRCECGAEKVIRKTHLVSGGTVSCGCKREQDRHVVNLSHGCASNINPRTPEYRSWNSMRSRCRNPNDPYFHKYGGRGVRVCERWDSFETFLADMGERPAGTSIDRIDVDGDYAPDNCRWATTKEQNRNRTDSDIHTLDGEALCLSEWAERFGQSSDLVYQRVRKRGWDLRTALTTPPLVPGRRISATPSRRAPQDSERTPAP